MNEPTISGEGSEKNAVKAELEKALNAGSIPRVVRFILGALGAVPLAGGVIAATSSAWSESDQDRFNEILVSWLRMQEKEIEEVGRTMVEVAARLNLQDKKIEERVRSPQYLVLVRKCFRDWAAAESEEKRTLIRNLLVNAASSSLCSDDVVRMFIEWIDRYSEAHFKVIRDIYTNEGSSRGEIWTRIDGREVREDSAEADLFKLLIHELSVGHVIRQHREKDYMGNYLKVNPQRVRRTGTRTMTSAFDDGKEYELTELGRQFVHYCITESVRKIAGAEI